ncbi:MAG: fructose-bisphosphatase, class II [Rhodospirillales bacterium RIFCSPLOWO2_12_FULL_58_28]|nr:MAG: fructose-bisphosphatase, class II [Rhodospirillales bacterium RIFCSPLOWO2_02_FULL_58_16]OHC76897.1 MAG: fructose-bisphosphatase, class II [Rhodospirillales bacterium RIFCSPLOWO2_12_FULL_58_28]
MPELTVCGRNLAMDAVRVTETAARAATLFMGRGDERAADRAAVNAMHEALDSLDIDGVIRIGESAGNEDAQLVVGGRVGNGNGPKVDVALMPLEGPTIIAKGEPNGLSVIAMTETGGFLDIPDIYMDKIAIGGGLPADIIDLDEAPEKNLGELAKAKRVDVRELVVCILDRPRHSNLIAKVRAAGARIILIADGDISGVIATAWPASGIDIYMGIGGAPQGVLSAAALSCVGGRMQGRLVIRDDADRKRAAQSGVKEFDRKYTVGDMASGDVTFAATGVTNGAILSGVRVRHGCAVTRSMIIRSMTGTLRFVEAHHKFGRHKAD